MSRGPEPFSHGLPNALHAGVCTVCVLSCLLVAENPVSSVSSSNSKSYDFSLCALERAAPAPAVSADSPAHWYTIKVTPGPDRPLIRTREKFNPLWWFGNADEPDPPESYRPHDKYRRLKWHLRNPFHNFTFYVIGLADKSFVRSGRYPEVNFAPRGGWNFVISRRTWLPLPFISYCHGVKGFHFYCGWRSGGVFGLKLNFE